MGLQNGDECWLGNESDNVALESDKKSETDCNSGCPGNNNMYCGGPWRHSIFYLGFGCMVEVKDTEQLVFIANPTIHNILQSDNIESMFNLGDC